MGRFIRTIGIKRAEVKITLANLAYNMNHLLFSGYAGTLPFAQGFFLHLRQGAEEVGQD